MKGIAIGVDDFKNLRSEDSYFVDKSLFIQELLNDHAEVILFPRPRRFGKTLNMSMLKYFFTHENAIKNRQLFKGLAIEKTELFEKHQGKYPVIFLSLKSCKGNNFEMIFKKASEVISATYQSYEELSTSPLLAAHEKEIIQLIIEQKADIAELTSSLKLLSDYLFKIHQKKVIILIDEYDTLIHEAYLNGFYDTAIDFLKTLLGNALKGNSNLQKAVITGILRISKESMFSDLNNMKVYSVLSEKHNKAFGFTQNEIDQMLKDYHLENQSDNVKKWYNGYYFGNLDIYNPWSILNFIDEKGRFNNYWINTSSNDLVHSFIRKSDQTVKQKIGMLINNDEVYSIIDENISFKNIDTSAETIISFFLQTGYLKAKYVGKERLKNNYKIEIPNNELRIIYQDVIQKWFDDTVGSSDLNEMLKALTNGDIALFNRILSKFMSESLSYFNLPKKTKDVERIYQAFLLGILISLRDDYEITSEKESGYGRYDIAIVPKDKSKKAIIMELKTIDDFNGDTIDQTLDSALKQIEDRNYEAAVRQQGCQNIMKIAITFDGKRVWTKVK
ncbi:MAG: AAA family ATPase [Bacteroidales bacterium]|nr:AAA family ATPase [Bacteroidales bacterium]